MNIVRCENGHYYDADIYEQCPHCNTQARNDELTVDLTQDVDDATTQLSEDPSLADAVQQTADYSVAGASETPTVGYYDKSLGIEPVVGWLVCVEGADLGNDWRLKAGRNFVGRSLQMDVSITGDDSVSRQSHAVVVYEPKTYTFLVQAGDSRELCYLNDKLVLNPEELKSGDMISLGNTKLMFIPCCSESFNWEQLSNSEQ